MIKTGKAPISLMTYLAIMSINLIVNLPGIAVAPMEGRLKEILNAPELEVQLLTTLPNFLIIPFVLLSGKLSLARHKIPIIVSGLILYTACAIAYLFANSMLSLVIISCILGCGAGLLIPFAAGLVADTFTGKYRMKQMGWKSGISNSSVVIATFAVGWLIESSNWHLPFVVYLVAVLPLIFSFWLRNVPDMAVPPKGKSADVQPADQSTEQATQSAGQTYQPTTTATLPADNSEKANGSSNITQQEQSASNNQDHTTLTNRDIDGTKLSPFTEEIISTTDDLKLSIKDGEAEGSIEIRENTKVVTKPDSLIQKAVDIAEEASELSVEALKLAQQGNVSEQEIEALEEKAREIGGNNIVQEPQSANDKLPANQQEKMSLLPKNPATTDEEEKEAFVPAGVQPVPVEKASEQVLNKEFYVGKIWALIGVYFFVTFTAIAIANYCSQLVQSYGWKSTIAGDVTAVFFLFVLLPGYCLPFFVKILRGSTFFWTALMLMVGLGLFVFIPQSWAMFVGAALVGLGYGICQPVLYDKASYTVTNPAKATLALAFVLTANYLAIAVEPFVISGIGNLIHTKDPNMFAFELSLGLVIAYTIISLFLRKKFAFSVDKSYYT